MSDNFNYQLSVKIDGQHLLNIRHENATDFGTALAWAVANAEQIQLACSALEGAQKPQPQAPAYQAPPVAPLPKAVVGGEIGPVLVKGTSKTSVTKAGAPMRSPRYTVTFGNNKSLSTFDEILAGAAEALAGQQCYYQVETKGEFTNLAGIRRA